ncbi:hypothetical protein MHJ96_07515 [Corynebacterium aurimucosum]|nr:hypothetical protein [Corynebacterium aurimucosum]
MAVYMGGKKVKELYYGGKKIKEAWYGSKKVYSAGGRVFRGWSEDFDYRVGDRVAVEGIMYECIKAHTSEALTNKPGFGWDQYDVWKQIGYSYEFGL